MSQTSSFSRRSTADDVLEGLDLKGRTILITECYSGIGFETMMARRLWRVSKEIVAKHAGITV